MKEKALNTQINDLQSYLEDYCDDFYELITKIGKTDQISCKAKSKILLGCIEAILEYMATNLDASDFFEAKNTLTKTLNEGGWHEQ